MDLFSVISNEVKAALGYKQGFDDLVAANDISRAIALMEDRGIKAVSALKEYKVDKHKINDRKDKPVFDKHGNLIRIQKRWRLPIPYQEYINEVALIFLYGKAVKWTQKTEGTDEAFQKYNDFLSDVHFDAKIRECKRIAGAETVSVMLFHLFQKDGQPDALIKVLAKSQGDEIRTIFDQYRRLQVLGWGYYLTEAGGQVVYHFDIYTAQHIHYCKRGKSGWERRTIVNPTGKIPAIVFEQEKEWQNVQPLIEREEFMTSVNADVNDRFANPAMVASAEVLNQLPKAEEEAKLYILKGDGKMEYLTWDQASESKKLELEHLEKHILSKSFTPDIDFDNMKGLSNISAKALRQMMVLASIKAERHKEKHDDYLKRIGNLTRAILGNVIDYAHKAEYERLIVRHEFQEPFGEDTSERLTDLIKSFNAGGMSLQTFVENNPYIKDSTVEIERLKQDQEEAMKRQKEMNKMDVFGEAE